MTTTPNTTGPESIVVSLEWAKKLRDAGWRQGFSGVFAPATVESIEQILPSDPMPSGYFYWMDVRRDYRTGEPSPKVESMYCNYPMIAAAPTAEEILRRLPVLEDENGSYRWHADDCGDKVRVWMKTGSGIKYLVPDPRGGGKMALSTEGDTLADAAAALWIYLKEHSLLPND